VPLFSGVKPSKAVLRDHFDPLYPDFNTDYPDQLRADEFLNEFGAYVRARDAHEGPDFEMPAFVLLYLPDDHTGGTRPNLPRPAASVADNDLALGRVVDAVSHSGYWDDTAIFRVGRRRPGWRRPRRRAPLDRFRGQQILARLLFSRAALCRAPLLHHRQRDPHHGNAARTSAHESERRVRAGDGKVFSGAGDQPAYKADYRNLKNGLIYERNRQEAPGAKVSSKMDFSRPDANSASS
jgi:hypothetical protein